jgi:alkanesulfonate monooxygenase SsuD/methylene tetrahydromethanopterin reductase-like flavin-dependent oxidoreductase (luciferase family)
VGVVVLPLEAAGARAGAISGSAEEIAEAIRSFRDGGFTQLEIMLNPGTREAFDALAPVVELVHTD